MKLRAEEFIYRARVLTMAVAVVTISTSVCWAQQGRQRTSIDSWSFLAEKYDKNNDSKISKDEYTRSKETFTQLDANQDGALTAEDWSGNSRGGGRRGPSSGQARTTAPTAGAPAPDFELTEILNADTKIQLSSFAGKKPVALIFGSCT